ncbi:MAG: response regulator [Comamonas sp.]|jgi:DNA-binding response OmpR family regulator|nr:response regulator [Comamonas sp.]
MHVLLVEDNALVASGVKAGLQLQGFGVDVVGCAAQADAAIKSSHFDVCVLDLGLPDEDGLQLLARWRSQGQELPVLVLTARDAVGQRIEGLQTGADDYLVKPFDLHELAARLHALLRRAAGRSVDWIVLGDVQLDLAAGRAQRNGLPVDLSRREWALLRALLQSPGRVLNLEQLRDSLYGYSQDVESNAVNVHVHHLRRKLGSDMVETVRGVGFRLGRAQGQGEH